jgi:hypothetical protein
MPLLHKEEGLSFAICKAQKFLPNYLIIYKTIIKYMGLGLYFVTKRTVFFCPGEVD